MSDVAKIQDLLIRHEGVRNRPYLDCCGRFFRDCRCETKGRLTVGVGRNLEGYGLDKEEAMYLLNRDVIRAHNCCYGAFPWFSQLNHARKAVLISMVFNLGLEGVKRFSKTLTLISNRDYDGAAREMLRSLWAEQVGDRGLELSEMMRLGEFLDRKT